MAKRYNYLVLGGSSYTALIAETYTLRPPRQGRASQRDTQLPLGHNGPGTNESFTQSFAWDDLGNPADDQLSAVHLRRLHRVRCRGQ